MLNATHHAVTTVHSWHRHRCNLAFKPPSVLSAPESYPPSKRTYCIQNSCGLHKSDPISKLSYASLSFTPLLCANMSNAKPKPQTLPARRLQRASGRKAPQTTSGTPRAYKTSSRYHPPNYQPKDHLKDIKGGLDNEMRGTVITDVVGLVENRLPDELFHRTLQSRDDITVVDARGGYSAETLFYPNNANSGTDVHNSSKQSKPEQRTSKNILSESFIVDEVQGASTTADDDGQPSPGSPEDEAHAVDEIGDVDDMQHPSTTQCGKSDSPADPVDDRRVVSMSDDVDKQADSLAWLTSDDSQGEESTDTDKEPPSDSWALNESSAVPPSSTCPSTPSSATFIGEDDSDRDDDHVPILDELFATLCEAEPLYDVSRQEWVNWPDTGKQKKEHEIADYLNKLVDRVREARNIARRDDDWVFSAKKSESPLDTHIKRKPDIMLVRRKEANSEDIQWKEIRGVGEIKSTEYDLKKLARESTKYSREMFRAEKSRRFALHFALTRNRMALIKYDRSGALVSDPFDIHTRPWQFLRVILGMTLGEDYYLGLDPSFSREGDKEYITIADEKYEFLRELHIEASVRGRGTVSLLVEHPGTGKRYVVKDQWVDRDRELTESEILAKLDEKGCRIGRLVKSVKVAFKISGSTVLDTTDADRAGVDKEFLEGVEIRDHWRLLLTPYGVNVTKFESLRELVSVFLDYAESEQLESFASWSIR